MGFPVKKADVHELLRKHGEEDQERLGFDAFRRVVSGGPFVYVFTYAGYAIAAPRPVYRSVAIV